MATNYTIIVNAQINPTQLQQQLNQVQSTAVKPISVPIKVDTSQLEKINIKIESAQLDLQKMAALYPKAFATQEVQSAVTAFTGLDDKFRGGEVSAGRYQLALKNVNTQLAIQKVVTGETVGVFGNLAQMMQNALQKIVLWGVGTSLIYGSLRDIKEGIQYIKDLNKAMTDTQVVSGYTSEKIFELSKQYNDLAVQLGSTTLEIASGNLEFIRAGYSAEEATKLLTAATIQSKLANMDAATSTDRLISTIHGFQMQTQDAMGTIDKLVNFVPEHTVMYGNL